MTTNDESNCTPFVSLVEGGKVLAVGAHWDDIMLGCFGTLLRLKQQYGYEVKILFLCTVYSEYYGCRQPDLDSKAVRMYSHIEEKFGFTFLRDAVDEGQRLMDNTLNRDVSRTTAFVGGIAKEHGDASLILMPPVDDAHPDHSMTGRTIRSAFREPGQLRLEYEIKRYTDRHFVPNLFIDLTVEGSGVDGSANAAEAKISFLSDLVVNGVGAGRAQLGTEVLNSEFLFSEQALRSRLLVNALDYADNRNIRYGEAFRGRISL